MKNLWKWYDAVNEPWRMLLMLVLISPLLIGIHYQATHPRIYDAGLVYILLLLLSRAYVSSL